MPSDEELRKVAEDLRALARSLARDFRQATDTARTDGRSPADALRHSLRGMADEARRNTGDGWGRWGRWEGHGGPGRHRRGYWYGPPPGWGVPSDRSGGTPDPGGADPAPTPPATAAAPTPAPDRRNGCRRGASLPPVRRRWDATTVAGALAVLFGTAWLLGSVGAVHVPAEAVVAAGLVLLGAAVVVTARTDWSLSRHRWPVWAGAGLVGVLIATSSTFGVDGSLRHVSFGHMSVVAVPGGTVYGGFGRLDVDASGLKPGQAVTVESVAGQTDIRTPPGAALTVDARVVGGRICVFGRDVADGVGAGFDQLVSAPGAPTNSAPPAGAITIRVHQMAGEVVVGGTGCSR